VTIDMHAHYVPPTLVDAVEAGIPEVPSASVITEGEQGHRFKLGDASATRPLPGGLVDVDRRLQWMDENDIDVQVVAPWVDVFGYNLPPDEGIVWSRLLNDVLREAIGDSDRFVGLASVPMQEPEAAAEVLTEAMVAGFPGVMIATRVNENELDSPPFEPFWAAASELEAVVFLHPGFGGGDPRLGAFGLMNAAGRIQDTTITAARLLYAGVPTRFAGAKIVLSHGGGALPFVLGRLARNYSLDPESMSNPEQGFEQLYFDSVVFDPEALRLLLEKAQPGHVMLGSDYPFPIGDLTPQRVIEQVSPDESEASRILQGTASSLFLSKGWLKNEGG
jgi:aminocarboxymuconate-semialdehyde decarboxylase